MEYKKFLARHQCLLVRYLKHLVASNSWSNSIISVYCTYFSNIVAKVTIILLYYVVAERLQQDRPRMFMTQSNGQISDHNIQYDIINVDTINLYSAL